MATTVHASLDIPELVRVLKEVDPRALLVPTRLLRRVIKQDRHLGGIGLFVPHRKSYVVARDALLKIADRDELGLSSDEELADKVILLVRPEPDRLARLTTDQALVKYWRMLFHARLDLAMQQLIADGTLNAETARQRIQRLGVTEFDEITAVMREENFLLPPDTPQEAYAEFVAVYLTLRRFADRLVRHFFPGLGDLGAVDALIAEDVDADAIYAATRLPGAPEPGVLPARVTQEDGLANPRPEEPPEPSPQIGRQNLRRLEIKAQQMDARGNNVRAAILRTRAAEGADLTLARARSELAHLSQRLKRALDLPEAEAEEWRQALLPLLSRSARGFWGQEARLLYDLQKVCVDRERGIYSVDLVEWALSLGRRPIRRPLPGHQEVAVVRHLRRALDRMRYVRLANGDRDRLTALLQHAVERREQLMRDEFRPLLADAMDEVGLKAQNVPEDMGRGKLIEELLDRVVDYGHLNFGNLRDAISRNQLKLPDLKSPAELVMGDPLIRLNRKLAVSLDGVYRGGEIYMRFLHRLSSLAFGTATGRFLVLFLILPFGLAFFLMMAPGLLVEEGEKLAQLVGIMERPPLEHKGKRHDIDPAQEELPADGVERVNRGDAGARRGGRNTHAFPEPNWWGVAGFGVFFLLLIHVGSFRSSVYYGMTRMGATLQTVFLRVPVWLFQMPALQALLHNRTFRLIRRFAFWPLMMAAVGGLIASWDELQPLDIAVVAGASFFLGLLLLNSRLGRDIEESITDLLMHLWLWFTTDFVPGLLRFIMDMSRWCLEAVEQVLYTVNEWLRFRAGENRIVVGLKAVLSLFWFFVTYVIRFAINLLIEPQINPIKHFPVVTVSHKICLPMIPVLRDVLLGVFGQPVPRSMILATAGSATALAVVLPGMTRTEALGIATAIIFGIPGIFGFAVWELKENWKLYASNRSAKLKPVLIGSHGETMLRLLKPGFHSGTLPKLFRKLRRAQRHGQQRTSRKVHSALHHVEESVGHFVERELLALLRQSRGWRGLKIELGEVHLATNCIAVDLQCSALGAQPMMLAFEQHTGWLVGSVPQVGWLGRLTREQRQTLALALVGLYKMAGIHVSREQIAEGLAPAQAEFDITEDGLVVWVGPDYARSAVYDLTAGPILDPQPANGTLPPGLLRPLDSSRLLFANVPVSWNEWVRTWERDKSPSDGERREWAYKVLP